MVIDIKMCRFDNVPWGFRLVGGSDFEVPLTVVKVTEGSLAEEAGLRVDDIIVRINDEPTSPMTHDEAHKVISHCGNVFYLGVYREDAEEEVEKFFPIKEKLQEPPRSPTPFIEAPNPGQVRNTPSPLPIPVIEPEIIPTESEAEVKAEDEEIASLLENEAEDLPEQNVVGVFPTFPGVCQSSEVLRQLKEQSIKTKQELEIEKKKWTTFMQKPNRPIPKSKQQLEAEARAANAYKVKIVKNYKKPEPVRPPSPIPEPEPEPEEEPPKIVTPPPEIDEEPPTDSEVPNLEQTESAEAEEEPTPQREPEDEETKEEKVEPVKEGSVAKEESSGEPMEKAPSESGSVREKTEEELQLELQLAEVQKQLLALANLPSAIQSTLDAVTKQLSELLPTFKLPTNIAKEATPEVKEEQKKEEETEVTKVEVEEIAATETEVVEKEEEVRELVETEVIETECVKIETEIKQEVEQKVQMVEVSTRNVEEEQMEEEQNLKRKKIELWNQYFKDGFISRKFFRENNCESVVRQLGKRVNFMKYQKPEKKIDLDKSEVYKVIHHLDRSPVRGIEVRPPVVVAEADVIKVVES